MQCSIVVILYDRQTQTFFVGVEKLDENIESVEETGEEPKGFLYKNGKGEGGVKWGLWIYLDSVKRRA